VRPSCGTVGDVPRLQDLFRTLPPPAAVREVRRERRRMLWRSLRGRCPLCASPGLRSSWATIRDRCAGCNFAFSRERGYLTGATWLNLSLTLFVLLVVLVGGAAVTMPDVPWVLLGTLSAATVVLVPIAFQPLAVTLFLWVDLAYFRPLDEGDLAANDPRDD
jgi:uncharacterized protein (DUF983 family)